MRALRLIAWPYHAGLRGVVWLDAHADFDTPEDNLSGFTDVNAVDAVFDRFDVAAAALTACDPEDDGDGAIAHAARQIAGRLAPHAPR